MPDDRTIDFRRKFLKLFGYTVIAATIGVVLWGVITLGIEISSQASGVRCRDNLKAIATGLDLYRSTHATRLPPYLAALLPMIDNRRDKLLCPADPDHGRAGSLPAWLRLYYGNMFANVDLDGPTADPSTSADTVRCSYVYTASAYPCHIPGALATWREEFARLVEKHGDAVPMVQCYYHVPERYVQAEGDPTTKYPDPAASPTYNITARLEVKEYPLNWRVVRAKDE